MSFIDVNMIIYVVICGILAISKRTRPIIIVVSALWLLVAAAYDFKTKQGDPIFLLIVSVGFIVNLIRNREKYLAQLKGSEAGQ